MKTKLLSLLFAMMFILGMLASCTPEEEAPEDDPYDSVTVPAGAPTYNVTWDRTELKYALTDSDSAGELKSGCKKYYSGTDVSASSEKVDDLVSNRNLAAAKQANVSVRFDYETAGGGWSGNIEKITSTAVAGSSQSPDIYANFVYDLSCAQLKGCFANLLQTGKANYFRFTESDYNPVGKNYFDAEAGEGYFYDYMKSLTLSDDKMYILGSNYCTDLLRAFLIVPMNVQMMSELVGDKEVNGQVINESYTGDMQQVSDFYDLVWRTAAKGDKYQEGFTYNVVAHYAEKVYSAADASDVLTGKWGFVLGTNSGLTSSGILYTTSVTVISKESNNDGTYTYAYPTDNPELDAFAAAISDLFDGTKNGIKSVHRSDTGISGVYDTELLAIRDKFSKNHILFGGVVALGSLDDDVYQSMRVGTDAKGFGVLPVPLYRSVDANGNPEEYKTFVHNIAKAVAIAKGTKNFTQCSAYLDYLSRMSQEILDEYYEVKLVSACEGMAGQFNVNMLNYIRNHVRDCFDKTFEDSVSALIAATEGDVGKWHEELMRKGYNYPQLSTDYKAAAGKKEAKLQEAVATWTPQERGPHSLNVQGSASHHQ